MKVLAIIRGLQDSSFGAKFEEESRVWVQCRDDYANIVNLLTICQAICRPIGFGESKKDYAARVSTISKALGS